MNNSNQSDVEECRKQIAIINEKIRRMSARFKAAKSDGVKEIMLDKILLALDESNRLLNKYMRIQRRDNENIRQEDKASS